ncbi:hypothetical protein ACFL2V_17195, partial [Pseudomonadota bacterium]
MRLKAKLVGLLLTGFTLLFALMAITSLMTWKQNQEENLKAFRNEFSEISLELFDNNAALFFKYFDTQRVGGGISKKEDALSFLSTLGTEKRNIMVFDLQKKTIIYDQKYANESLVSDQNAIERAFDNWTLMK